MNASAFLQPRLTEISMMSPSAIEMNDQLKQFKAAQVL